MYQQLSKRKIKPIIPTRKGARIKKHGNQEGRTLARDQNISAIRKLGRKRWKQTTDYHRRSLAESTMFRFKMIFGDRLTSRIVGQQQVEVKIKCKILNQMTGLARPNSYPLKKVG